MNIVWRRLFELVVMRLLWGPWNLLVGIIWTITDDVAEDVTFAHFMFGAIGTVWLIVAMVGVSYFSASVSEVTVLVLIGLSVVWLAIYCCLALILKAALSGRNEYVFSLR